jgi:hypothetical protein
MADALLDVFFNRAEARLRPIDGRMSFKRKADEPARAS